MALKLNLEKAYDRLNWDFIFDTLHKVGLPDQMVYLIMKCITTAPFKVFWNGEVIDSFAPCRGIRQVNPLSPYIFLLCRERLAHKILAISEGQCELIRIARECPELSHLFFIDDIMLFTEASLS